MVGRGTPATLALERAAVAHRLLTYQHDPGGGYGTVAAAALGVDPAAVLKTLVATVDGVFVVAIVPVTATLGLKALAAALAGKRAVLAEPRDAERATGYVVGGISPIGARRRLPTVLERAVTGLASVYVSGGRRGLEIELTPADLIRVTDATLAPIAVW